MVYRVLGATILGLVGASLRHNLQPPSRSFSHPIVAHELASRSSLVAIRDANETVSTSSNSTSSTNETVSVPGITSALNVTESPAASVLGDWAYCTCKTDGENGTLVYEERQWPNITSVLPELAALNVTAPTSGSGSTQTNQTASVTSSAPVNGTSFLQVSLGHKTVSIAMADDCECTNPWGSFKDPTGSAVCSVNNSVNICLVKVKNSGSLLTPDESRQQALELIGQIDSEFMANNS